MRYHITYSGVIMLASWLFLLGCNTDQNAVSEIPTAHFRIVDSIDLKVNDDFVALIDYYGGYYLGVNSSREKIYLYNQLNREMETITIQGSGPNEYGNLIKCGFIDESQIGIIDQKKYLIYDIESKNIETCSYEKENMLPMTSDIRAFPVPSSRLVTSSSLFEISPSEKRYFDEIHTFSTLNNDCKIENYGEYPPGSIYREKLFPSFYDPIIIAPNPKVNEILQIFPMEKKVYIFEGEDFKLTKTLSISPDKFGEIVHRGDDSMESIIFLLQKNSLFRNIVANDQIIVLQYLKGMPDAEIAPSLASYNQKTGVKRKKMYSIFDKQGNQLCHDFEDERVLALIGFDEEGHLLVKAFNEEERNIIYMIDITFQQF